MFLGYAIVQLPGFIFMLFECVKSGSQTPQQIENPKIRALVNKKKESKQSVPAEFRYTTPTNTNSANVDHSKTS